MNIFDKDDEEEEEEEEEEEIASPFNASNLESKPPLLLLLAIDKARLIAESAIESM